MNTIQFNHATYYYPLIKKPAISDLTLTIERGKFYGVVGENAAGKSTFCNMIRGLCPHFYKGKLEGEVLIDGQNLLEIDEQKLAVEIGFVFQNPFLQMSGVRETVFEEVGVGLENIGVPREKMIERILQVARELDITALLEKNPMELSGGQCQRVAFASILAMDAQTIVIDEPTSQLDPEGTRGVFKIINFLKNEGKTVILVEHKIDLVAQYADELIVLKDGRLVVKGPTREVIASEVYKNSGAPIPVATRLGYSLIDHGYPVSEIPVTNDDAVRCIRKVWEERYGN